MDHLPLQAIRTDRSLDKEHMSVRSLCVSTTPEASVLDIKRYADLAKHR